MFIQGAAPNRASLGATNGLCQVCPVPLHLCPPADLLQMTVSIMRAIGPAVSNSLFSLSIDKGYLGGNLVYYILTGMVGMALYVAFLLPRKPFV